jgi:hypothetical protein
MFDILAVHGTVGIETLRRSVATLPPGHSVGAMSRDQAQALFRELEGLQQESRRYRELVKKLKGLVARAE